MTDAPADAAIPRQVDLFPSGEIGVVWKDGHESVYAGRRLRLECPCAACIDEVTGRRILDAGSVPADLQARLLHGVGNYGVQIVWSDGHSTGIYSHRMLRALCPCASCGASG